MAGDCLGINDLIRSLWLEDAFEKGFSMKKSRTTSIQHLRNLLHNLPRDLFRCVQKLLSQSNDKYFDYSARDHRSKLTRRQICSQSHKKKCRFVWVFLDIPPVYLCLQYGNSLNIEYQLCASAHSLFLR